MPFGHAEPGVRTRFVADEGAFVGALLYLKLAGSVEARGLLAFGPDMSMFSAAQSVTYRSIRSTLIAAAIVVLLLAQRYAAFMLFLLVLPLVPWLLYIGVI